MGDNEQIYYVNRSNMSYEDFSNDNLSLINLVDKTDKIVLEGLNMIYAHITGSLVFSIIILPRFSSNSNKLGEGEGNNGICK